MMHSTPDSALACLLAAVLLAGCAETPIGASGKEPPPPNPRANAVVHGSSTEPAGPAIPADPAQVALRDGIAAYDNGDYQGAIKKLGAREIANSSKANQLIAIKYTAFSYCVSGRPAPCRQQFDKALKLDPAFELELGETGHPLWGPVFARAKKSIVKVEKSAANAGRARR
jgi:hypothetical protein